MKVLLTADAVGGVFSYAVELAASLARLGVRTALATKGRFLSAAQRAELRRVPGLEVHESADRLEWMEDPWDDVARSGAWILSLAERLKPDVVHLNEYAPGSLPLPAPKLVVGHSCVTSWFHAVRGSAPPPAFDRYRREVARGLAAADLVVAPTRWMLSELERHYVALPRARVVPNGRSAARFRPGEKEAFVLCAARLWDPAKNAAALDAAARDLPWPVLLAGEVAPPGSGGGEEIAPGHAHALGQLPAGALAALYARAAIYALPARYEPFGLSVLEAALSGCALVLGDIPSLRETWDGAARFVDPGSPEAIRAALADLVARAGSRADLGARARERALALSPERTARAYLDLYRELVASRRASAEAPTCAS